MLLFVGFVFHDATNTRTLAFLPSSATRLTRNVGEGSWQGCTPLVTSSISYRFRRDVSLLECASNTPPSDTKKTEAFNSTFQEPPLPNDNTIHNCASTRAALECGSSAAGPTIIEKQQQEQSSQQANSKIDRRRRASGGRTPKTSPATSTLSEDSAARVLIDTLVQEGITTFFGICGGPSAPLFEAIRLHPEATFVQSRHETNAAFACSTYYRATNRLACLVVSGGPGITNCVNGVASASAEEDPMLVLAGDVSWLSSGKIVAQDSGWQGLNAERTLEAHTRRQIRVLTGRSIVGCAMAAIHSSRQSEKPGPSLLIVPIDVATQRVPKQQRAKQNLFSDNLGDEGDSSTIPMPIVVRPTSTPLTATTATTIPVWSLDEIATELLIHSKKPLIIIGMKCRPYRKQVEELLQVAQIPFVTTVYAKGLVSETRPPSSSSSSSEQSQTVCWPSLHNCGLGRKKYVDEYAAASEDHPPLDIVLAIGTDLDDAEIASLDLSNLAKLYHVHTDATMFNRNYPTHHAIISDAGTFCRELKSHILSKRKARVALTQHWEAAKQRRLDAYNRAMACSMPYPYDILQEDDEAAGKVVKSCRAIYDLQASMPGSTKYIADIGDHTFVSCSYLDVQKANSFFVSLKLGSMGSGIGGAIGLGVAASMEIPENTPSYVVAIVGDGCMQMYGMEVLVAVKYQLPIVFAIINDARYNIVHHGMNKAFSVQEESMVEPEQEPYFDCPRVNFAQWGRAIGVKATHAISRPGQIDETLMRQLMKQSQGGPILLDITVDPSFHMSIDRVQSLTEMFSSSSSSV